MILIIYGTRPEFIKIKPLIEEMKKRNISFKTLFTGQHINLIESDADYNIKIPELGSNRLDTIFSSCMNLSDEIFENVNYILVQGDTTSVIAMGIAAMHRKIKIIHLEAGLRTYDFENPYPEEYNRKLISSIADIHLCPTKQNVKSLKKENINPQKIFLVGNTGLDNLKHLKNKVSFKNKILITLHRRENHDNIKNWFKTINILSNKYKNFEFILPIHPNPNVSKHKNLLINVNVVSPLKHNELIDLILKSNLVITDSGGIQEECSFFNKMCLVCRKTTERPESLGLTSFLVPEPKNLLDNFDYYIKNYKLSRKKSPYGDGNSSARICDILSTL
jgi:UDP-N-acetylglucosamine 2-epimerase (non-hydrolysing)